MLKLSRASARLRSALRLLDAVLDGKSFWLSSVQ
jgi:hypothetical protein